MTGAPDGLFSIRSPHRSKGRPDLAIMRLAENSFQSAPLTEARGDPAVQAIRPYRHRSFNPLPSPKQGETAPRKSRCRGLVSIRSPHRSKGRPLQIGCSRYDRVSIRSPHRSKGRHHRSHRMQTVVPVSIRSPHRSKGRPNLGFHPPIECVSIRSPHRSKGRPPNFRRLPSPKQGETGIRRTANSFNPLPSPKQGETQYV